jgi:hypothetical protein
MAGLRYRALVIPLTAGLLLAGMLVAGPATAELRDSSPGGFTTHHQLELPVPPAALYQHLVQISDWWEPDHSWSGDANNLYLEAKPGGCFCERLPDGGWVEHLHLVYLAPGKELRFNGALGPLQQLGLQGAMSWKIEATETGSRLDWTYTVHGHMAEDGLLGLAPVVDAVNGAQVARLAALLGKSSD